MNLKAIFKAASVAAILLPIAACGRQTIGVTAKQPDMRGDVSVGEVWNGRENGNIVRIQSEVLKAGEAYETEGLTKLIINGDIPSGVDIKVMGELLINGNVGDNVGLQVQQPYAYHREAYSSTCPRFLGKTTVVLPCTKHRDINDGLSIRDADPAIEIHGGVGSNVNARTYGNVEVNGHVVQHGIKHFGFQTEAFEAVGP